MQSPETFCSPPNGKSCKKPDCPELSAEAGEETLGLVIENLGPEPQNPGPQLAGQAAPGRVCLENPTLCNDLSWVPSKPLKWGGRLGVFQASNIILYPQSCQNRHPQSHLNPHILERKSKFSPDFQGSSEFGPHHFLSAPFCSPPELPTLSQTPLGFNTCYSRFLPISA